MNRPLMRVATSAPSAPGDFSGQLGSEAGSHSVNRQSEESYRTHVVVCGCLISLDPAMHVAAQVSEAPHSLPKSGRPSMLHQMPAFSARLPLAGVPGTRNQKLTTRLWNFMLGFCSFGPIHV